MSVEPGNKALEARIIVALAIIAVCASGAAIALAVYIPRRRREKLRRRGVKDHRTERGIDRSVVR